MQAQGPCGGLPLAQPCVLARYDLSLMACAYPNLGLVAPRAYLASVLKLMSCVPLLRVLQLTVVYDQQKYAKPGLAIVGAKKLDADGKSKPSPLVIAFAVFGNKKQPNLLLCI